MRRRKQRRADGGFLQLARMVTRSEAFRSLSPRAGWLLIALMDRYEGQNNRVPMSIREAATWIKSGLHQARSALEELEDKGFIRLHQRGGFTCKVPHATTWTLTMFGRGGQKATLDFRSYDDNAKHGCQDGNSTVANTATVTHPPVAAAATVERIIGCQDGNSADAAPATLIQSTMQGTAQRAKRDSDYSEHRERILGDPGENQEGASNFGAFAPSNGAAIRDARKAKGLTQYQLADIAQTHQPIISNIERGNLAKVGESTIARIKEVVGL